MARRFRDSGKWRGWYRELPPKLKLLFDYLCDECDHAGVYKEDYAIASLCIGLEVTKKDVEEGLKTKVIRIDHDKIFIPSFVEFQYKVSASDEGPKLNPGNKAHLGVIRQLQKYGIDPVILAPTKGLRSPLGIGIGKGVGIGTGIGTEGGSGETSGWKAAPPPEEAKSIFESIGMALRLVT